MAAEVSVQPASTPMLALANLFSHAHRVWISRNMPRIVCMRTCQMFAEIQPTWHASCLIIGGTHCLWTCCAVWPHDAAVASG